jgi:methionyl-tRNA formyltransferase
MSALSVLFLGTPGFAVPSLIALHSAGHRIARVVTQPDRPRGRGRQPVAPPVKKAALELGLPILQPVSIRRDEFLTALEAERPDAVIVVAFGQLLPKRLLDLPRMAAVNVHGSLLPQYRGPAPIQWAIINGEPETGVTTMLMDEGIDTGDLLLAEKTPIEPTDTSETLHDRLSELGAALLVKTLDAMTAGTVEPVSQKGQEASYAPMLTKSDGRIDWNQPPERIDCFIRGMTPWPGAFSDLEGRRIKIFRARPAQLDAPAAPGTVVKGFSDEIRVAARDGALSILELQVASGKRLSAAAFLRGCAVPPGKRLT